MSREISVTKVRRGPTLRLIISAMRKKNVRRCLTTGTIDVDGLAMIIGKFQLSEGSGGVCVATKKCAAAKNFAVSLHISMGTYEIQFLCPDKWADVTLPDGYPTCSLSYENSTNNMDSYTFVINITVYVTMPTASVVNNHLYEDTESTDFQLHTADGTVAVHKAVLAFHSDMLKTMLRGDWKENEECRINVEAVSVQTLQHLKQYMYLDTLPEEGLESLLIIAVRCLMKKLEADCITKMIKSLKPENFNGVIEFACQNNLPQLVKALVLGIPDSIVNSVHQLKINEQESSDTE